MTDKQFERTGNPEIDRILEESFSYEEQLDRITTFSEYWSMIPWYDAEWIQNRYRNTLAWIYETPEHPKHEIVYLFDTFFEWTITPEEDKLLFSIVKENFKWERPERKKKRRILIRHEIAMYNRIREILESWREIVNKYTGEVYTEEDIRELIENAQDTLNFKIRLLTNPVSVNREEQDKYEWARSGNFWPDTTDKELDDICRAYYDYLEKIIDEDEWDISIQ